MHLRNDEVAVDKAAKLGSQAEWDLLEATLEEYPGVTTHNTSIYCSWERHPGGRSCEVWRFSCDRLLFSTKWGLSSEGAGVSDKKWRWVCLWCLDSIYKRGFKGGGQTRFGARDFAPTFLHNKQVGEERSARFEWARSTIAARARAEPQGSHFENFQISLL